MDDQLIACNSRTRLDEFKAKLNERFECSDGGPVSYFLGFNVFRNRPERKLFISQEHYIEAVLERFDMADCNLSRPLFRQASNRSLRPTKSSHEARHEEYPATGRIHHVCCHHHSARHRTCSRCPGSHCQQMEQDTCPCCHAICFDTSVAHTDLCLTFDATSGKRIILGYADADWGGCLDTRRSTTGYLFKTFGGPWLGNHDDKPRPLSPLPKPNTWHQLMQPGKLSGSVSSSKTLDTGWTVH